MVLRPSYRIQCCSLLEDWVCLGLVVQNVELSRSFRVDFSPSRPHMLTANAGCFPTPKVEIEFLPLALHHQLTGRCVPIPTRGEFMKGSKQRLVASGCGGGC